MFWLRLGVGLTWWAPDGDPARRWPSVCEPSACEGPKALQGDADPGSYGSRFAPALAFRVSYLSRTHRQDLFLGRSQGT